MPKAAKKKTEKQGPEAERPKITGRRPDAVKESSEKKRPAACWPKMRRY